MQMTFSGEIVYWRGPAPFHFVMLPRREATEVHEASSQLTYGWGCIPAQGRIGGTDFTTALFPKDGGYAVPVKVAVRRAESLELGDVVEVHLEFDDSGNS
jgi:hypothetical protein